MNWRLAFVAGGTTAVIWAMFTVAIFNGGATIGRAALESAGLLACGAALGAALIGALSWALRGDRG